MAQKRLYRITGAGARGGAGAGAGGPVRATVSRAPHTYELSVLSQRPTVLDVPLAAPHKVNSDEETYRVVL
ncbi:unnamed protein product, partial [Brenthis ino]